MDSSSSKLPSKQPRVDVHLLHEAYIDESSQTKHRYLCLGGLLLRPQLTETFEAAIAAARLPELPYGELAWTKVSNSKLQAYYRVVDAAFALINNAPWHQFHILVIDTHKLKDNVFNAGNRDIGFNKEIYQLCQKLGRLHRQAIFHIYLDRRSTKNSTSELQDILNHGIRQKQPGRDWPYRRVHFRDSDKCLSIQVVDILLGAVAFHLNGHRAAKGASAAKSALSDHVLQCAGVADVTRDTSPVGRFTIWHRQLR